MSFSFANFFKPKEDNLILSVEQDNGVDYLDKISESVFGDHEIGAKEDTKEEVKEVEPEVIHVAESPIEEKVKSIRLISGLSDEKINEFYDKMKVAPESAKRMIESVLAMLSADEKKGKEIEGIIETLSKKLSPESLAKITAACVVLAQEDILKDVIEKK